MHERRSKVGSEDELLHRSSGAPSSPDAAFGSGGEKARFRRALANTAVCVGAAVCFGLGLWRWRGKRAGFEFFAGYLVEQSLSVDNLFVFIMLFNYFQVPLENQGRVLTWGILGAVLMRGVMIGFGVAAVQRFRSVILVFAAILLLSAVKLFFESDEPEDLSENLVMRVSKRLVGATDEYDGEKFFTTQNTPGGKPRATPLLLCLVCIELSDFVFAVDSIPAVIGVSQDVLIVYSSNVFAILGLRSLYTLVAKAVQDLPYLRPAVALVLAFIGLKMILEYFGLEVPIGVSLSVVAGLLAAGVLLSLASTAKHSRRGGGKDELLEAYGDVAAVPADPEACVLCLWPCGGRCARSPVLAGCRCPSRTGHAAHAAGQALGQALGSPAPPPRRRASSEAKAAAAAAAALGGGAEGGAGGAAIFWCPYSPTRRGPAETPSSNPD